MPYADHTAFSATALNSHQIRLNWTESVGANLMVTQVYFNTVNNLSTATFHMGVPKGVTSHVVGGLSASTLYYFWVKAQDTGAPSPQVATGVTANATTSAATSSISPSLPSLPDDVLKLVVSGVKGLTDGTAVGTDFSLFARPVEASPTEAGFIYVKQESGPNPNNRVYTSLIAILLRGTDQKRVHDAAEGLRTYLHPLTDKVAVRLASGRQVLAIRSPRRIGQGMDTSGRYQVELEVEFQMQGNELQLSPEPATPAIVPPPPAGPPTTLLYQCVNTASPLNTVAFNFRIRNDDTSAVNLSSFEVRYWFNNDGLSIPYQTNVWWAGLQGSGTNYSSNVAKSIVALSQGGQTNYFKFTFSGIPTLGAGLYFEVQAAFNDTSWNNFNQTNDYSFDASKTSYTAWTHVTVYYGGTLIYGVEP